MTANSKTPTINDWLAASTAKLAQSGIVSARLDGELLVSYVLKKPRTWLHANPEHKLSPTQNRELNLVLKRRLNNEPLAFIAGAKEFYSRNFRVNSSVLVPRPESEDFIEIIKTLEEFDLKFVDIGTGSGILAVTTALEQTTWSGTATDIDQEALNVAKQNAKKLGANNLVFKVQNLLANSSEKYDVIIANLPYVPKKLHGKTDLAHEPEIALFSDNNGLAHYQELFQQISDRQHKPTHILTESLETQHAELQKLASNAGYRLKETKGLIQHFVPA